MWDGILAGGIGQSNPRKWDGVVMDEWAECGWLKVAASLGLFPHKEGRGPFSFKLPGFPLPYSFLCGALYFAVFFLLHGHGFFSHFPLRSSVFRASGPAAFQFHVH